MLQEVDVLGIRSKTQLRKELLEQAPNLLAIGCFCIGTNQVDLATANVLGIPVFNAPFSNTRSVAELVIGEVVMLARQAFDRSREVHLGEWNKRATNCHEIRGKTLGIVGYGRIGRQVGVLAEAMGMRVVFFDVASRLPMGNNRPAPTMVDLLRESDFVTVHVPETAQTKDLIGRDELAAMKAGACLLNLSRGSVVVIEELAAVVRAGHLGGCAIDVYPEEPEANGGGFQSPLQGLPNTILTPHVGGSTSEAQEAIGKEVSLSLAKFVTRGTTTSAVNFPEVEMPLAEGKHRIFNVHRNVPGVLRDINKIVSDSQANIFAQVLSTDANIGVLVMDLDQNLSTEVCDKIAALGTSIRTRVLGS